MATRYLVRHPRKARLSLIVDVVEKVDEASIARVRRDMHGRGCAHGLVVDASEMIVLRDTFSSMEESAIEEEHRLPTNELLNGQGTVARQVGIWLERVGANWHAALPAEDWAMVLLYDIVPALSGSEIERFNSDAA